MLNTTWTETYMCVPLYFILRRYRYFWWSSYNVATEFSLCYQSCNWHRGSALSNATLRWKCRDSRLVAKKQKTKCYSSWTRLYNRGNTSSKMLPRQDECCPRLYLGKDEVECGNTASLTRGGPAARTREMGQYFQAVLYQALSSKYNTSKAPQGKKVSHSINCFLQYDVKLSEHFT